MHYIPGKGYFDQSGEKVGSKRKMDIALARSYGFHGDHTGFTTLIIESRVNRAILNAAFREGSMANAKSLELDPSDRAGAFRND